MADRTVMLAFPHPGHVSTEFMLSVLAASNPPATPIAGITDLKTGPFLSQARGEITTMFLDSGLEWLWMVDADMRFTADTLPALLAYAHPDTVPVIGATCQAITRNGQVIVTAYRADKDETTGRFGMTSLAGDDLPPDTLIRVDATGCACLLIHRTVFTRLDENWPGPHGLWFAEQAIDGRIFGEDMSFCLRCGDAGIPVHVHTGIQAGHMRDIQVGEVTP